VSNCQHCEQPAYVRGLCVTHYNRLRKYGDALEPSHKRQRASCGECVEPVPAEAKGLCKAHYQKWQKTGVRGGPLRRRMTRLERYLSYVDKRGPDDCWPWTAGRTEYGYGVYANEKGNSAHRYGFEALVRPLETGEIVDHVCHNRDPECQGGNTCEHRACQNPAHWEALPNDSGENTLRAVDRYEPDIRAWLIAERDRRPGYNAAMNRFKTHCKWGHKLTPENSYGYKGRRQCKTCARLASRGEHPRQLAAQR
jgi:hypothetical protein